MNKNGFYIVAFLIVIIFWQWAFYNFKGHFSGLTEARVQLGLLEEEVQRAQVRTAVVQYQFDLFRQDIAKWLPSFKQKDFDGLDWSTQKRGLASVVQIPDTEALVLAQFDSNVDELRDLFEHRQFKQVIRKAKNILALNPVSPQLVSIYFMLAESYYQTNELDHCLDIAQQMTQLFPEHEKTGYVLLRVGLFLKEKNRIEEARNMFSVVAHAFAQDEDLKLQSQRLLDRTGRAE